MVLKTGKINPLNVLGLRRVDFPAHHFIYTELPRYNPNLVTKISTWIDSNLKGRYYIGQYISLIDNTIVFTTRIGFENDKELSFFNLACPDIN